VKNRFQSLPFKRNLHRYTLVDAGGYPFAGVIRDGTPANFGFVARGWLALFTSRHFAISKRGSIC
jgi:hypothetical protein